MPSFPKITPAAAAIAGITIGGALAGSIIFFRSNLILFLGILALLIILFLGGYILWIQIKRKKRSQLFSEGLDNSSSASPKGISDPNKRARLDELKRKFQEGLNAYRSRGKELSSLPWYVIVGESGGGKSEAIRHSNIGFPPGLQDELQGVGGTINMHWWFANEAVILDTAGRMIFEEVPPGESSEWKEFLGLLKTTRPGCPINGMLLVIPCDSLIKDSEMELERKAKKLAQQLDLIQRSLDVRFPVSILITKCDLLVGFREYFDDLRDPKLQHQMLGWSNPEKLDSPFKPGEVDLFLQQVAHRLGRRRLAMLRDPAPESNDANARRADEVDTLFSLPNSLLTLAPRLRRYLETIFQQGSWSLPPLFLRGIYFSSALREGGALDADLASALGVPVESVGDFKVWERERSFFLRDLFIDKIFREKGLVTRATNTQKMLWRRKLWLYGGSALAMGLFVSLGWIGMRSFQSSVASQSEAWEPVARKGWIGNVFADSLVPVAANGAFQPVENGTAFARRQEELGEFHLRLRNQSTNAVKLGFISKLFFSRLAARYEKESRDGQRIVFETSVVKPLVDSARQKAGTYVAPNIASATQHAETLVALLQLEADILSRWGGTNFSRPDFSTVQRFANPLLQFVAGSDLETNLLSTWTWLYNYNDATLTTGGRGTWPPAWLTDRVDKSPADLRGYPSLQNALESVFRGVTNSFGDELKRWDLALKLHARLKELSALEQRMMDLALLNRATQAEDARKVFLEQAAQLEQWLRQPEVLELFPEGKYSLAQAQARFKQGAAGGPGAVLDRIDKLCAQMLARGENSLFTDVQQTLKRFRSNLAAQASKLSEAVSEDELKKMDMSYLDGSKTGGKAAFLVRRDAYAESRSVVEFIKLPTEKIGREGEFFKDLLARVDKLASAADDYKAGMADEFRRTHQWFLTRARVQLSSDYLQGYLVEARTKLNPASYFPLGTDRSRSLEVREVTDARKAIRDIRADLAAPEFKKEIPATDAAWSSFTKDFGRLENLSRALVGDNGITPQVEVVILEFDRNVTEDSWRRTLEFAAPLAGGERTRIGDRDIVPKTLGKISLEQPLELRFSDRDQALATTNKIGAWGALDLLRLPATQADTANPNCWLVQWPLADPKYPGKIRLRLRFNRPLPGVENNFN